MSFLEEDSKKMMSIQGRVSRQDFSQNHGRSRSVSVLRLVCGPKPYVIWKVCKPDVTFAPQNLILFELKYVAGLSKVNLARSVFFF